LSKVFYNLSEFSYKSLSNVLGFAIEFRKKKLGKHACGTGNTHAKSAIECVFPKKIFKTNSVIVENAARF